MTPQFDRVHHRDVLAGTLQAGANLHTYPGLPVATKSATYC
jgi:hypothetical protein